MTISRAERFVEGGCVLCYDKRAHDPLFIFRLCLVDNYNV